MAAILQPRVSRNGPERFVLALALLTPLLVMSLAIAQLSGMNLSLSWTTTNDNTAAAASSAPLVTHRPAASNAAAPPTLVAPTATPIPPTPTTAPVPTTPPAPRTYTVQHGDELKQIAAEYRVSIWSIIDSNNIPNPDSLRVGQVLRIPEN